MTDTANAAAPQVPEHAPQTPAWLKYVIGGAVGIVLSVAVVAVTITSDSVHKSEQVTAADACTAVIVDDIKAHSARLSAIAIAEDTAKRQEFAAEQCGGDVAACGFAKAAGLQPAAKAAKSLPAPALKGAGKRAGLA